MSRFLSDLRVRCLPREELPKGSRQLFEVESDFIYLSDIAGVIVIPEGFKTDFGSVPAITKFLVDDDDPDLLYGSLPHDYLYSVRGKLPHVTLTREEADEVLREAMRSVGAPAFKTNLVYTAVRVGGGTHWKD